MPQFCRSTFAGLALALALVAVLAAAAATVSAAASPRPFQTAIIDPDAFGGPDAALAYSRARAAGISLVRVLLDWSSVAPAKPPQGFLPGDPGDRAYRWAAADREIRLAVAAGLQPLVCIYDAPSWAEKGGEGAAGTNQPDPTQFALFARAAATRYGGAFHGLPRVRYWQAWNEPNVSLFLNPQFVGGKPFSPGLYRTMVNEFAAAVHGVHADDLVVVGGTAPFRDITQRVLDVDKDWGPLSFMRDLLCLSPKLKPTCTDPIHFDVWAHDPYSSGGPTHHAVLPNDVSLGDLPEMRKVLDTAIANGTIVSRGRVGFWVTEFSWDSNPPDPQGVPAALEARWVAEALYRMWQNRVDVVTWFLLRDQDPAKSYYQSGLYLRGATLAQDRPKPALTAYRFPVVAFKQANGVLVWLRTPGGRPGSVVLEQSRSGRWQRVGVVRTDSTGIYDGTLKVPATGSIRGRLADGSDTSLGFGLRPVPDHFYNPFGQPTLLEPRSATRKK